MPTLISPDKAGTLSEDARTNLENELAPHAARLSHDLSVGDRGIGDSRAKGPEQRAFDAQLAVGIDPFAEAFSKATEEHVAYFLKMGVPMDKIARALRGSGIAMPPDPVDRAIHDIHHDAIVAQPDAKPSDYSFDLGRLALDLPKDQAANVHAVLSTWSAELKLDPTMAKGIGEYVIAEGPRLAKFSDGQRASWISQQNSSLLKSVSGDKAAAAAIVAKATKVLSMSGAVNGGERFSDAILNGVIGKSAWLLQTLANHADAMEAAEREKKKL